MEFTTYNSTITHAEGSLSNTCPFSVRHNTAFWHLGALGSPSALHLGAILNSYITNAQKYKEKTHGTK